MVSSSTQSTGPPRRGTRPLGATALAAASVAALVVGLVIPDQLAAAIAVGAGAGLFILSVLVALSSVTGGLSRMRRLLAARRRMQKCPDPMFLTDDQGRTVTGNRAARGVAEGVTDYLSAFVAMPEARMAQLLARAVEAGGARDELAFEQGTIAVEVSAIAPDRVTWRFVRREHSDLSGRSGTGMAIVTLDADGTVLGMTAEASELLGAPAHLSDFLGDGRSSGLATVDAQEGPIAANLFEIANGPARRDLCIVPVSNTASREEMLLGEPGLLDALPVPMLKIATDGRLIAANREARDILGLGPDDAPPLFELVEGMGRPIVEWLSEAAQGRGLLRPEIVRAILPGQELFLQITLGRAVEDDETVLIALLNDATQLKTLEAQFVQSQKMQAIGQLAGGVAHDFNNLLTAISGHCDLLLLRHDAGDPDYADLTQIAQNANRAASLVSQLLAFSRKQNMKPQPLDLRETMSDLGYLLNRLIGEQITLEVDHAPGTRLFRADRRLFEQVIVNLVVNARDAMPDGGKIHVSSRTETLKEPLLRDRATLPVGDYVVLDVADSGTGIAPDYLPKVFEPFFTTKRTGEGTGLGLSTAYGIVKQTGGYIFVESTVGVGTRFSLYFPACAPDEQPRPISERSPGKRGPVINGEGVVMLVEDEAPVRAFASRALRLRGFTVIEAEDAEEALSQLEDETLKVDVFVTDVIMPGMDGPTWVSQALVDRPDARVVFVSGYSEEGRAEKQARIPNSVFLPKPFSLEQLTSVVHDQLS